MKMVKCTTEHIVWDVDTGRPIETKYHLSQKNVNFFLNYSLGTKTLPFKTLNRALYRTQV